MSETEKARAARLAAQRAATRHRKLRHIREATGGKRLDNRGKIVAEVLKALNAGQGHASLVCDYDSACGEPDFFITVYRERDGQTFAEKGRMSQGDFEQAINDLTET